ncbi:hypothetical protein VOLCADRAFT_90064 [Volvox carteri f. nagariensis]|uniref:Transglutaminase-like domain-containing protein n=1 Tax=Volvox carteri f. nagariensis TaxID=3068 RepID=D8TTE1_VOLCA|nr:uncharacterized protein VOLCADRAFT_90064 [Volvox carteri f. nagariensis]EFJ49288.1 hypothetical protein VOLCADRAFT_90064 [Volvox carteri f. nagariensis]|eukprot:XP_002949736.1 hypothetical protein VOLCADRAFT_90064 [Volvox carteri f. nagariensis]
MEKPILKISGRLMADHQALNSPSASISGRSSTSRASRSSRRGSKKPVVIQVPPEPVEERKTPFTLNMQSSCLAGPGRGHTNGPGAPVSEQQAPRGLPLAQVSTATAQLSAGLSQLGRTADGLKPAYLTLTLNGTDLATADPVAAFQHLQSLHLRDNRLTEIRALGSLRNLTHVDVSGNKLTQAGCRGGERRTGARGMGENRVLDLRLGPNGSGPTNLRSADFSRNCLDMLRDLSAFSRLTHLSVANNRIERLGAGLRNLGMLKVVDLSSNRLVSCRGLEGLCCLRELHLDDNLLTSLELIKGLDTLHVLTASHNRLRHLAGVGSLSALRTLDVSHNLLGKLEELVVVRGAPLLGSLDVRGNPLDKAMSLRLHVVHLLPQVIMLDGVAVDSKEKVLAANMHGADAEGLRLIRRKYFPNGELADGGGAIPPLAAGLVASQAEEECAADGSDRSTLLRLDAWAASIRPESVLSGAGSLVTLADQLSSVCVSPKAVASGGGGGTPGSGGSSLLASTASRGGRNSRGSLLAAGAAAAAAAAAASTDPQPQLQRARVCWRWVVTHVAPMARLGTSWDVETPLFGASPQAIAAEQLLLSDRPPSPPPGPTPPPGATAPSPTRNLSRSTSRTPTASRTSSPPLATRNRAAAVTSFLTNSYGTWAERVARLFTLLCRACELDAVPIPGYWKHSGLAPGDRVHAHNHCWAGVKVNGRWRLVDPTAAALVGGQCPFYVPPEAFLYSYWPLEAAWQLVPEPLSQEVWWALPYASLAFFAEGCQLGDERLEAVNVLPAVREGGVLPAFQLEMYCPRVKGAQLQHRLREAGSGKLVAEWPPREPGVPAYAFQQVVAGKRGTVEVRFGAERHLAQRHQLWSSLPGPGEYQVEVVRQQELPGGGLTLALTGLPPSGLKLKVVEEQLLLRVKVVLPPNAPHDVEEDGILHSPAVLRTPLPYASAFFTSCGGQMVTPLPYHPLEADRLEPFNVVVAGAARVALMADGLEHPIELPPVDHEGGTFATSLQVPRAPSCTLMAYVHNAELSSCAWMPLVQMAILPQSQHIVFTPTPIEVPEVDPNDPYAYHARDIFKTLDKDLGALVTRREILLAFRRNRQHADILKCPPRISQHDGTFEKFIDVFLQIDTSRVGAFSFNELAAYMDILPSGMYESTDEEEDFDSVGEGGGEDDVEEDGGGAGPADGGA